MTERSEPRALKATICGRTGVFKENEHKPGGFLFEFDDAGCFELARERARLVADLSRCRSQRPAPIVIRGSDELLVEEEGQDGTEREAEEGEGLPGGERPVVHEEGGDRHDHEDEEGGT